MNTLGTVRAASIPGAVCGFLAGSMVAMSVQAAQLPFALPFADKARLLQQKERGFDRVDVVAGPLKYVETASEEGYKAGRSIPVTGRMNSYVYDFRPGISAYQLNDEMENRLRMAGYQIVYRCQGSECGELDGWRVFLGKYVSGVESSQYYVLARRVRADTAQQFVQIYANDIGRSPRLIAHTYEAEILLDTKGRAEGAGERIVEIPFSIDSAELTIGGREALRRFVAQLVKSGTADVRSIEVAGYTDAQGTAQRNEQLSQQRAEVIARWLRGEEMLQGVAIATRAGGIAVKSGDAKSVAANLYRKADIKVVLKEQKGDAQAAKAKVAAK